jgi:hypothetical protein
VAFRTCRACGVADLGYIRSIQPAWERGKTPHRGRKGGLDMPEGYCVKERKKVEIKDAKQVTMKNGRPAIQGVCPDCGTKIFKIGKLEA